MGAPGLRRGFHRGSHSGSRDSTSDQWEQRDCSPDRHCLGAPPSTWQPGNAPAPAETTGRPVATLERQLTAPGSCNRIAARVVPTIGRPTRNRTLYSSGRTPWKTVQHRGCRRGDHAGVSLAVSGVSPCVPVQGPPWLRFHLPSHRTHSLRGYRTTLARALCRKGHRAVRTPVTITFSAGRAPGGTRHWDRSRTRPGARK